jgi:hypothetical protein
MSSSTIYGSDVPVAGIKQFFGFRNATLNSVFYGNETYITSTSSATSTLVGGMIRIADTSTTSNTVRGFEAQAYRGTNTQGENTGLSGFGRTFGVRGTTLGDAGSVYLPAGVFAESQGTVQGNALRAYSGTITSEDLVSIFHDTSNFIGAGIQMNFGNAGGSFAATSTAKFLDLQVAGTSKFVVSANGSTTIGDGTTNASLMIPRGGICVDNDGSCISTTTGQISARVYVTGATDLAEMYFSNESLAAGEIVALSGGLSIDRADETNKAQIIGVVASNPGIVLGEGDKSLVPGEGSYPVGLKGRLPIKLSTENGPIHKGDRITLSSIPGVGMKATASSRVVGIALEDFDGSRAYSAGYLDQYGDRMVTEKITKSVMIDPKTQDGCYMGGGSALGEAGCDPEAVKSTTLQTTTDTSAYDTALAALTNQPAATTTTAGGTVTQVGQAIMFIELADYQIASESLVLAELATTTALSADVNDTLWNRLKSLATNFVDGVLTIAGIKADRVEVGSELCVDGVCVTADDLRALLQSAGRPSEGSGSTTGGGAAPAPTPEPELPAPEPTPVEEGGGTGGGSEAPVTDPVPTTEEPAGSAPTEPVVEAAPVVEEPAPAPEPEAPQPEPAPSSGEPAAI